MLVELNIKPIVLIDDISSELDQEKLDLIFDFLTNLDVQMFVTDIDNRRLFAKKKRLSVYQIDKGVVVKN